MRIGIDGCCWSNRRGFGRYTRELVTRLVTDFPSEEWIVVVDRQTASQTTWPAGWSATLEVVPTREQPSQAASANGSRSLADLWRLGRAASRLRADVFFFPAVYSFYPLWGRTPIAVTFHDALAENLPGLIFPGLRSQLLWRLKTWLALRQASRIVTVSGSARAQVSAAFGLPAADLCLVSEGASAIFRPVDDAEAVRAACRRHGLRAAGSMLLYVGGISPHKNLQGLLVALSQLGAAVPWQLVLVGDYHNDSFHGCHADVVELSRRLGLADRVTFTGHVADSDLVLLYNAATALVLPSFNEGFGLPVVEAMACGLPVAASRRGSLPEVLGSAGLLFDPADPTDMASALARLLSQPGAPAAGGRAETVRTVLLANLRRLRFPPFSGDGTWPIRPARAENASPRQVLRPRRGASRAA